MLKQSAIVVSAPSGTGKESVINTVLTAERRLRLAPSWTTRERRKGDSPKYKHVSEADFRRAIAEDKFLEHKTVVNHLYGTCLEGIPSDAELILEIDYQGALELKQRYPALVYTVFLLPPSFEELKRRLQGRNTDSAEEIARRLALAPTEVKHAHQFDSWIVNDKIDTAASKLRFLIMSRRNQMKPNPTYSNPFILDKILATFNGQLSAQ